MIFLQMVRHGGCLGLGLAAMGSHRQDVYEQLKFNLYQDDAVTGEAAGIAMGMVMLGSKSTQAIEDMVAVSKNRRSFRKILTNHHIKSYLHPNWSLIFYIFKIHVKNNFIHQEQKDIDW